MDRLLAFAVRALEVLFFAGWIGSAIVLLWAGVEDFRTVFERHEPSN